jgi:hypothetical protein
LINVGLDKKENKKEDEEEEAIKKNFNFFAFFKSAIKIFTSDERKIFFKGLLKYFFLKLHFV